MIGKKEKIRSLLLRAGQEGEAELAQIRARRPLERCFLRIHLRRYVLIKFLLEEECGTEDFHALAQQSMARSMKISPQLVEQFDLAKSCDGTSSLMVKKVLLLRSIEKGLELELPAEETTRFGTLTGLADLVWRTMEVHPVWSARQAGADKLNREHRTQPFLERESD